MAQHFRGLRGTRDSLVGHGRAVTEPRQQSNETAPVSTNLSHQRQLSSAGGGTVVCLHGCVGGVDDMSGMPTEPSGYRPFVDRINAIANLSAGERVVGGLSMGANLAAAAGEAVDAAGQPLYTRQLILNPMLHLHLLQDAALTAFDHNRLARQT